MDDGGNGRVAMGRMEQALEDLKEWKVDMEKRVRALEGFRWQIMGALLLVQGVGVAVILGALKAWSK